MAWGDQSAGRLKVLPLLSRWYAFGPFVLICMVIWREFGWRRALPVALGGWLIAFAAEWASTSGPGVPFGAYSYRDAGLVHDWRLLGVPLFDSLSFTWLAFCTFTLTTALGARGGRRLLLAALAMVAIDLVVDPVALRGAHWYLGSIYSYPPGSGIFYGVSLLNYLGWLVVGLALQGWLGLWLSDRVGRPSRLELATSALLLAGVMAQSTILALLLGVGPSALLALGLLAALGLLLGRGRARAQPPSPPLVLIACALTAEARAVRRALGRGWVSRRDGEVVSWRRRQGPEIEVWETGMGLAAAAAAARRAPPAAAIVVAGVGGAGSEDWPTGSVAVGARVLDPTGTWLGLEPVAHDRLVAAQVGRSATLGSRETARETWARGPGLASLGVDVVEMETAAWASQASPGGSPAVLVALRAVSDTPTAPLGALARLIAPGATSPSPLRLSQLLLRHPGYWLRLAGAGKRQRLALRALGRAVATAVPVLVQLTSGPSDSPLGGLADDQVALPSGERR